MEESHTRNGEKNDLLISEFFACLVLLRHAARSDRLVLGSVRDVAGD